MSAGLPGAGLGVVLYTILIFLMPIYQMVRARHAPATWKLVTRQCLLLIAMIGVVWLESELAVYLGLTSPSKLVRLLPLILLVIVLMVLELIRWLARRHRLRTAELVR